MQTRFQRSVGLSDHTLDNTTAITSVAMGACTIEKHVTIDRCGGGPDDSFSLEADETITAEHVKSIRPSYGLAPKYLDQVIGKTVSKNIQYGAVTNWDLINDSKLL